MLNQIHVPADPTRPSDTPPAEIDALFEALENQHINRLILYVHGGLHNRTAAEQTIERLGSGLAAGDRHLVGLVWESGAGETIQSIIARKFKVPLIEKAVEPVRKWLGRHEAAAEPGTLSAAGEPAGALPEKIDPRQAAELERELRAALDAELAEDDELEAALRESLAEFEADLDPVLVEEAHQLEEAAEPEPGTLGLGTAVLEMVNALDIKGKISRAGLAVLQRRAAGRDHGLRETIVEELVREFSADKLRVLWDDMKDRAMEMWRGEPAAGKPAAYFLEKLAQWQTAQPGRAVDLIGHSAGAIVLCNLMATAAWKYDDRLTFRDVIFLAPAVTMDFFYDEVVTKPERYRRFRMFTMADEKEKADSLKLGDTPVYGRSLLYAISGLLEDEADQPLAGMTRFLSGEEPFDSHKLRRIGKFLRAPGEKRLIEAVTEDGDLDAQCSAITHDDFDSNRHTLKSLRVMLAQDE